VYEYRYDALRRLDQVKIDGVVEEEFTYDANGNRLTYFKQGVGTVSATYDDQDRLLTYGTWVFTYTANGELETKTDTATSEEWLFQYDALGNLVSVGLPNGDLVEYLVDGMGRRVGKKKNGVLLKQWIYRDALKPVAELDGAGALVSEFVYGAKANVPEYVIRGGATYRVVSDHLGSPRRAVNVANSSDVPFSASYGSFGETMGIGIEWIPFGFAGGIYDSDTGLTRFGARDYDPVTGRWTTKDPQRIGRDGANLYVYATNDPVNRRDATGRESCRDQVNFSASMCSANCSYSYPEYEPGFLDYIDGLCGGTRALDGEIQRLRGLNRCLQSCIDSRNRRIGECDAIDDRMDEPEPCSPYDYNCLAMR
jgi:RHS repeat-associated protein